MSRFKKLNGVIVSDDKEVFFFDLFLNPFQVESVYDTEVSYYTDEGKETRPCSHLVTKSGSCHDVIGTAKEIINILEC